MKLNCDNISILSRTYKIYIFNKINPSNLVIFPFVQNIGIQAKVVKTIIGMSVLIRSIFIDKPPKPEKSVQLPSINS